VGFTAVLLRLLLPVQSVYTESVPDRSLSVRVRTRVVHPPSIGMV
jgi:hypothetical protein